MSTHIRLSSFCDRFFKNNIDWCCRNYILVQNYFTCWWLGKEILRRSVFQRLFLTLSSRKAEKPASPTVTNSRKAKMPACRSLIYSRKAEISAWKFWKKTVKNNVGSGSSGSGDPMLWELRVRGLSFHWCPLVIPVMSSPKNVSNVINDNHLTIFNFAFTWLKLWNGREIFRNFVVWRNCTDETDVERSCVMCILLFLTQNRCSLKRKVQGWVACSLDGKKFWDEKSRKLSVNDFAFPERIVSWK